jgi:hypothetical protein
MKRIEKEKTKLIRDLAIYGTGASSTSILKTYLGMDDCGSTPSDSSDLMRCITVVRIFDIDISIMKGVNQQWKGIVKVWHKLVKCCDDFSDDEMRRHNSVDVLLTQIHQKVYNKQKPWTKE